MAFKDPETPKRATQMAIVRHRELSEIPVELQVIDRKHAQSEEVLTYCINKLSSGVSWDELRRMLGLGPAYMDARWRAVREALPAIMLPDNEDDALKARYSKSVYLLERVEELIRKLDERTESVDSKVEPQMYRVKFEALKLLLDENRNEFDQYLEIKKMRERERGNRGVSIIFQNNFHVPRPGDDRTIKDVAKVLTDGQKVLDGTDSSK